jgi:hypothetical protein
MSISDLIRTIAAASGAIAGRFGVSLIGLLLFFAGPDRAAGPRRLAEQFNIL